MKNLPGELTPYWEKAGKEWADVNKDREGNALRKERRQKLAETIARLCTGIQKPKILEVGCSYAENLKLVESLLPNAELYGIDVSAEAINMAKERMPVGRFQVVSALDLPYPDGVFDVVFSSGVMIHIHPKNIRTALHQMIRVSKSYIVHVEVTTDSLYAKCNKLSSKLTHKYGPRRPYLFKHDYAGIYSRGGYPQLEYSTLPDNTGMYVFSKKK